MCVRAAWSIRDTAGLFVYPSSWKPWDEATIECGIKTIDIIVPGPNSRRKLVPLIGLWNTIKVYTLFQWNHYSQIWSKSKKWDLCHSVGGVWAQDNTSLSLVTSWWHHHVRYTVWVGSGHKTNTSLSLVTSWWHHHVRYTYLNISGTFLHITDAFCSVNRNSGFLIGLVTTTLL